MKIAYIYDVIYPYIKGGAEKRFWELARRLSAKGHEVHIFGMRSWEGESCFIKEGVQIHGIGRHKRMYLATGRRNVRQVLYFALRVLPSLWRERFDIVDCNAFLYLPFFPVKLFSFFKGIPLVVTWQEIWDGYWYKYLGPLRGGIARCIERVVVRLSSHNIAHSLRTRNELIRLGVGEENIKIIPHGIDFKIIENTPASTEAGDLVFVGRLVREKNVDVLIETVFLLKENLNNIKCVIIGEGPEKPRLISMVNKLELNSNIIFKGTLEYSEIVSLMKSSRVFVFPSVREGFGIAVIEAMACGLPVITVKHPMNASAELIRNQENGFLCELDAADLSRKVLCLLNNEASRREFSRVALDYVKDYDWDRVAQDNEDFYNFIIRKERD